MQRYAKTVATLLSVVVLASGVVARAAEEFFDGYRVVNVIVNGKTVQSPVPAIIFKGSTLIPLRAVTDAFGATLQWDSSTYTANIALSQPVASQAPAASGETEQLKGQLSVAASEVQRLKTELQNQQAQVQSLQTKLKETEASLAELNKKLYPPVSEVGQSRLNPMATGLALTARLEVSKMPFTARFTALEVIRGSAAWTKIYQANQFNDPPGTDEEYILIRMKYELLAIDDPEAAVEFSEYWFTVVSASGKDYPRASVVVPDPEFGTRLYKGASDEGWLAFKVSKNDQAPLLTFARDSQGKNGYWMTLKPTAIAATSPSQTATTSQPSAPPPAPATSITLSSVKTAETLAAYLAQEHGTVLTPLGSVKLTYEITHNDRTFLPFDYWIRMRFEPSTFFLDLSTKNNISTTDKQASIDRLREHAKTVYGVAAKVFPDKKIHGQYYDSWYKYPTIQAGFEVRRYLTWQNYDDNLFGSGDSYSRATLSTFRFEPLWDDTKF